MSLLLTTSIRSNRTVLLRKLREKYRRALHRIGGYTRRVADSRIRRSSVVSSKGSDFPKSQTGAIKGKFMRYAVADDATSVVIGPSLLRRPKNALVPVSVRAFGRSATRLSILMFGGVERTKKTGRKTQITPRPFMQAALDITKRQRGIQSAFKEIGY